MKLSILVTFGLMAVAFASPALTDTDNIIALLKNGLNGRAYENELREFLEKVRVAMEVGYDPLDIPILAPYHRDEVDFTIDASPTGIIGLGMTDLLVEGLNLFQVIKINLNLLPIRLEFDINMPDTKISAANYILEGNIMENFRIFGNGTADIEVKDFSFKGNATITIKDGFLFMRGFMIDLNIKELKCDIKGLLGGGDVSTILNDMLNELIPGVLVQQRQLISELIGGFVVDFANPFLSTISLQDILDIIGGGKRNVL